MNNIIESIEEDVGIIVASPKYGVNEGAVDFLKQMKVDILKTYFLEQLSGYKGYWNGEGIRVFER